MVKRRRVSSTDDRCMVCLEVTPFTMIYVGCSNSHTICHKCARGMISSNLIMHAFPLRFPGQIKTQKTIQCPACKQGLHGFSNMFVTTKSTKRGPAGVHACPYKDDVSDKACTLAYTPTNLHKHLIDHHMNTVCCPSCNTWINKNNKNDTTDTTTLYDVLSEHIHRDCKKVSCVGCDQISSMANLYLHSCLISATTDNECSSWVGFVSEFSKNFWQVMQVYGEDRANNTMSYHSRMVLSWVFQYMYHNEPGITTMQGMNTTDLLSIFVMDVFIQFLVTELELTSQAILPSMNLALLNPTNFQRFIHDKTKEFSTQQGVSLSGSSALPYYCKQVIICISDYEFTCNAWKKWVEACNSESAFHGVYKDKIMKMAQKVVSISKIRQAHVSLFPISTEFLF